MTLAPDTESRIARHWAEQLNCSPEAFSAAGVTVADTATEGTIRLFRRGDALVVAAPDDLQDALADAADTLRNADLPATEAVNRALAGTDTGIGSVYGPYFLGYVDEASFSPVESTARLLVGGDDAVFEQFRERVPDEDWGRASPVFRPGQTAGLFADGELVAVATLTHLPFPDVGVVVDPEHRGRGYGRAVVSTITRTAFDVDRDAIVRYRTRESAPASARLAESLGYERWATSAVLVTDQTP